MDVYEVMMQYLIHDTPLTYKHDTWNNVYYIYYNGCYLHNITICGTHMIIDWKTRYDIYDIDKAKHHLLNICVPKSGVIDKTKLTCDV